MLTKSLPVWWEEIAGSERKWLLLGKGPTFQRRAEFDLTPYFTVALNHTIRELPVDVASAIDMDVVRDCGEAIERNARYLLMPRFPAEQYHASDRPLETYFDELPLLHRLNEQGRLIWYNLSNTTEVFPGSPIIPSGYFSAEMITTLIALCGGRCLRTLGVDGGITYATTFRDLDYRTRLANGQPSFDMQFAGIAREIRNFNLDFAPLTWTGELPVRIFPGAEASETLIARVLEYSLRKLCPVTMEWRLLQAPSRPASPNTTGLVQSLTIPRLAGYSGRAAFLDAHGLVFKSFREIWELPFTGATWLWPQTLPRVRPPGIMLLDCGSANEDGREILPPNDQTPDPGKLWEKMTSEPYARATIPSEWCMDDQYLAEKTAFLRYTDPSRLPWKNARHPEADLWVSFLHEAVRHKFIPWDDVVQAVWRGEIRRSILEQVALPPEKWPQFNRTKGPLLDLYWQRIGLPRMRLQRNKPQKP